MKLQDHRFYHVIDLPDGRSTPGIQDLRRHPEYLGLDHPGLFSHKRVLDVGANDGFWSFWSEKAGASDVLAIDVDNYADYDWGYHGPPEAMKKHPQQDKSQVFYALRSELGSKVRRERISVYDLSPNEHGLFDIVVFYGVLYHLRHPALSFDRIRKVCTSFVVVETHINNYDRYLPYSIFFWDDVFHGDTNWTGPSEASVVAWMRSAGFDHVFVEAPQEKRLRQRFVGVIDAGTRQIFMERKNLRYCDEEYFEKMRARVRDVIQKSTPLGV